MPSGPFSRDAGYCSIGAPVYMGIISDRYLNEISGLAYSRQAYNVFAYLSLTIAIFVVCYKQSYPGFVGAQRLRWGPYYQRNLTGR